MGVRAGVGGWLLTVAITATAATLLGGVVTSEEEMTEIPAIVLWMANLPLGYKLLIIGMAMTVEEAFFRGFLQPRVGLWLSTILFAISHFSYGLPFLVLGVFCISVVIGRTMQRSNDLIPCIVAHGVFDAIQLIVILPLVVNSAPQ